MAYFGIIDYIVANPVVPLALILLYCFFYALSVMFFGSKSGPNPFSIKNVKSPKPVVTDHNLRNKILKQRFKAQKVPDNIDTIIIGSGIGGMSTAVLLGRAGHKVLVLEQHDQAGGCCHTFVEKGFEFDTGIHYVGKMMEGDMTRIYMDQLTEGQVVWEPMGEVFDTVTIGPIGKAKFYPMKSGSYEIFAKNLEEHFPTEKDAIAKFIGILKECSGAFMGVIIPKVIPKWVAKIAIKTGIYQLVMNKFMRITRKTVRGVLDELSQNEEFKAVASYIFGDMGVVPSELSMMAYGTLINHYIPGSFYPRGGTSEIAFQIIQVIEKYGGRVLVDAPVSEILISETGRAHGVRVKRSGGDVDLFAKRIISDAGILNTFKNLLPKEVAVKSPVYGLIGEPLQSSISFLTGFYGLDGSSQELGLPLGNVWSFLNADFEKDLTSFVKMSLDEAAESDIPLMFTSFPSAKDTAWNEKYPGKSVALVITLLPWQWFSQWESGKVKHRGDDYDQLKLSMGRHMWNQLVELYPQLEGKMEYMDVGTPLSNKYYLGQPEGDMYGLHHSMARFLPEVSMELRPETGIPGLYLTGQDILTCGFSGAMHAGLLTASKILKRNMLTDIQALSKEIRAQIAANKKGE